MILSRLKIHNFRNIARADIELGPGITLFWGANAQGKTTLLEAVYYLATGRSFRTRNDRECLPWNAPAGTVARVEGRVEQADACRHLAVALTDRTKYAWMDGKALARLTDLIGHLTVVLFTPADIAIVTGPPALRRRYLDGALCQVSTLYLLSLQRYTEALRQRNAMLRAKDRWTVETPERAQTDSWADLLVEHGVEVSLRRREALRTLADMAGRLYAEIAPDDGPLELAYRSASAIEVDDDREAASVRFRQRLQEVAETEKERGQTLVGPHRDDFAITIGGRDAREYGSQGQQRSVALALRLAQVHWMAEAMGEKPILLVDDLGSELDRDRRSRLLPLFSAGAQTLATTAERPDLLGRLIGAERVIEVRKGRLIGA